MESPPGEKRQDQGIKYRRIVLKLSGEALRSKGSEDTISEEIVARICTAVKELNEIGVQVALVVGGGNIYRGASGTEKKLRIERNTGDFMGMLATVINGLALMSSLETQGVDVRVLSAIPMNQVAEPYILRRAVRHLERGRVVVMVAGTGNPYFTTDTTAALRGNEIGADVIMKATKVDGIYDKDPMRHADAKKYDELTFDEALSKNLSILDSTAFALCKNNNLPIIVFNMNDERNIKRAVQGEKIGTRVVPGPEKQAQ